MPEIGAATETDSAGDLRSSMPEPPVFASIAQLSDFLQIDDIGTKSSRARMLLENATALIQGEAGQYIAAVDDDVVTLPGSWSQELWLPERPVTAVSAISINDVALPSGSWTFSSSGQLYVGRLPLVNGPDRDEFDFGRSSWGGPTSAVTVTYSHGYAPIPVELRAICLALATRAYQNPQSLVAAEVAGLVQTSPNLALTEGEKEICRRYGRRSFSMSVM